MKLRTLIAIAGLAAGLSACGAAERLSQVGKVPELAPIDNRKEEAKYKPINIPMPAAQEASYQPNSLWQAGSRTFFKDQRASKVGDILTVNINIADSAKVGNETIRSRSGGEDANFGSFFGVPDLLASKLPGSVDPSSLVGVDSKSTTAGNGKIDRNEQVNLTVAAYITQVLPNGNLVIFGRQEVRVNYEVRELFITGIVRPEDISNQNTIQHTQIAEARIAYGGRGQISDIQQPRYGQQIYDILMPF